jgi:hypothetical protein
MRAAPFTASLPILLHERTLAHCAFSSAACLVLLRAALQGEDPQLSGGQLHVLPYCVPGCTYICISACSHTVHATQPP